MARKNPVEAAKIAECREMLAIRRKLKMSVTAFAHLLDMSMAVLQSRERESVPWQAGEAAKAKRKIAKHLEIAEKALAAMDA